MTFRTFPVLQFTSTDRTLLYLNRLILTATILLRLITAFAGIREILQRKSSLLTANIALVTRYCGNGKKQKQQKQKNQQGIADIAEKFSPVETGFCDKPGRFQKFFQVFPLRGIFPFCGSWRQRQHNGITRRCCIPPQDKQMSVKTGCHTPCRFHHQRIRNHEIPHKVFIVSRNPRLFRLLMQLFNRINEILQIFLWDTDFSVFQGI